MNRRNFLAQTSAWAAAAVLPKLSEASVIPSFDAVSGQSSTPGEMSFPKNFLWGSATASYQVESKAHGISTDGVSLSGIDSVILRAT
jgi:beta-glucosidase